MLVSAFFCWEYTRSHRKNIRRNSWDSRTKVSNIFLTNLSMETSTELNHMSHQVAYEALESYKPTYPEEIIYLEEMKSFLDTHDVFAHRSNLAGHFTGSAWVINPDATHALLIHHVKLDRWFQPGGHTEYGDASFRDASLREAREEIGVDGFKLVSDTIFDIDVHPIPEKGMEPAHKHYDVRYLLTLDNMDVSKIDTIEVHGARWIAIDELLQDKSISQSIRRMAEKTRQYRLSHVVKKSVQENIDK